MRCEDDECSPALYQGMFQLGCTVASELALGQFQDSTTASLLSWNKINKENNTYVSFSVLEYSGAI